MKKRGRKKKKAVSNIIIIVTLIFMLLILIPIIWKVISNLIKEQAEISEAKTTLLALAEATQQIPTDHAELVKKKKRTLIDISEISPEWREVYSSLLSFS